MRGIDMPGLNVRDVRQLPVPVPEYEEQVRIAARLDAVTQQARDLGSSIDRLQENLPPLEAGLLASFAYGEQAAAIGDEISGALQSTLSQELAAVLVAEEARRRADAKAAQKERRGHGVKREDKERDSTNPDRVVQALESLGTPCSPETLFGALRLDAIAVDSFYAVLRRLRDDGKLAISRPDSSKVLISLTDAR